MGSDRDNDEFNAGPVGRKRADGDGDVVTWTLRPGEVIQAAGPTGASLVPSPPRLGIMIPGSRSGIVLLERIPSVRLLRQDTERSGLFCGMPLLFSTTEGGRVVLVHPKPDRAYRATWI